MKIAIRTVTGFLAVEAKPIEICGIPAAYHKSPSSKHKGWCWAVTDPLDGIAFARSSTSLAEALKLAETRIESAGVEKVRELQAQHPVAPPVESLETWAPPVKTKVDLDAIVEAIHTVVNLTPAEKEAVKFAFNSRTGQLKAKSPSPFGSPKEELAAAAWYGIQPNGYKLSVFSILSLRGDARELYERLRKVTFPAIFDKDKAALVSAGIW